MQYSKNTQVIKKRKISKRNSNHPASFRDPSGSLFFENNQLFRKVNFVYKDNYDYLNKCGLYKNLVRNNLLVSHKEVKQKKEKDVYKIIKPELIPFISYPYEWCFTQLKDAAILTLKIARESLRYGMILKDASAFNVQFFQGKPIFIDTLSFEKYKEGEPWAAYQQFCRHFLAPLLLASYKDYRLMQFSKIFIDGIPLDLTSRLLPKSSFLNFSVISSIHLHAKAEKLLENKFIKRKNAFLSKNSLLAILGSLESLILGLKIKVKESEWQNYYKESNYTARSLRAKKRIVKSFIKEIPPVNTLWDLGANTGYFSKDITAKDVTIINFDNDFLAIEKNYEDVKQRKLKNILPLVMDLVNPSSGLGWMSEERDSLINRGPCDVALALALVHHLVISNNLPFNLMSKFFNKICKFLVIEFVPKDDSQVRRMLLNRKDVFYDYNKENFERALSKDFKFLNKVNIKGSDRILYFMKKK